MPEAINQSDIPEITTEEDAPQGYPVKKTEDVAVIGRKHEEKRKDAKAQHEIDRDKWVTLSGFILVLVLLAGFGIVAVFTAEKPYITAFLNLLSSSIMLVLGYIFGSRNNQP